MPTEKLKNILLTVTTVVAVLAPLTNVQATNYHAHADIRASAKAFAMQLAQPHQQNAKISIKVGKLDSRLKLAQCSKPLEGFESPNSKSKGNTTVGIRCNGEQNWKMYIPVSIAVNTPIATLKRAVTRNSVIKRSDVIMKETDVSNMHQGYFTKIDQVVGKHTKTSLRNGTELTPRHLKNPLAVNKGSSVLIVADLGGIQVRMKGKALKSGSIGDWITVENSSSNRKIEGRILQDGIVAVML